ncbi:MAG: hypothetical protein DWQ02_27465 [Bacteroidetes bacterium]|nr:MAG: hypothetical protein DWQ02_27465 [Bacteroidota bacterium]
MKGWKDKRFKISHLWREIGLSLSHVTGMPPNGTGDFSIQSKALTYHALRYRLSETGVPYKHH